MLHNGGGSGSRAAEVRTEIASGGGEVTDRENGFAKVLHKLVQWIKLEDSEMVSNHSTTLGSHHEIPVNKLCRATPTFKEAISADLAPIFTSAHPHHTHSFLSQLQAAVTDPTPTTINH
ncbi:unnamed protein product [Hymenolepis diminuta]|uniref:Uncharacterized protein n=1 Tax=Hymenolepis diminuta TaxID=6216 RepID=A0A0R3SHC5_HYMDI|nr:unnamed protein product [Hymenolepis diminuta]VUZ55656.1 unnamed protein product [Hymenolepis diminuta]